MVPARITGVRRVGSVAESLESRCVCAEGHHVALLSAADYASEWLSAVRYAHDTLHLEGYGQTVAIVDSGIAYDHPALGAGWGAGHRVVGGWDFTAENDGDPYDDGPAGFHGTHVAGIVASDDARYPGVAPEVDLVGLRVFDDQGQSDFRWIERALQWVIDHRTSYRFPITTVNLSLGVTLANDRSLGPLLDDELSRLADLGVFVVVAAGNGYDRDGIAELDYPASSRGVIPVGSVDALGELSRFSRRRAGLLVAPGENITSTITDYLFDFNGRTDDFYAFSGTSQAAPQVAGAAVLIREALHRAGHTDLSPRAIEDVFRRTADTIWDERTQQSLQRIDLRAALDLIMPDDYGDDSATATDRGRLGRTGSLAGRLETVGDRDVVRFLVGQTGLLRMNVASDEGAGVQATWSLDRVDIDATQPVYVNKGQILEVALTGQRLASYQLTWETQGVQTIAPAAWADLDVRSVSAAGQWFQMTPTSTGLLSIGWSEPVAGGIAVRAYERTRAGLAPVVVQGQTQQVDIRVIASSSYLVQVVVGQPTQVHLANFVQGSDGEGWVMTAPARWADVAVELGAQTQVTIGPWHYVWGSDRLGHWSIRVGDGGRLRLRDDRFGDALRLRADRLEVWGATQSLVVFHHDQVDVAASPAAGTELRLYGTTAHEVFTDRGGHWSLTAPQRRWEATGFGSVVLFGGGGIDRAELTGSSLTDELVVRDAVVRFGSAKSWDVLEGMSEVTVLGGETAIDRAYFYGTEGDDSLSVSAQQARFSTRQLAVWAESFEKVFATAGAGGVDRAFLQGTTGDDLVVARDATTSLSSARHVVSAVDFEQVYAYDGGGGFDRAKLFGSDDDDTLVLRIGEATLASAHWQRTLFSFDQVYADAGTGREDCLMATLPELSVAAWLSNEDRETSESLGYLWYASGFDRYQRDRRAR